MVRYNCENVERKNFDKKHFEKYFDQKMYNKMNQYGTMSTLLLAFLNSYRE